MTKYRVYIPAFVREIEAIDEEQALNLFDEAYDDYRAVDPLAFEPVIEEIPTWDKMLS